MSIKYYQLAKDEEPPDEFCVIMDIGGEPSEYMFYVPEAENAKLREMVVSYDSALHRLCDQMQGYVHCRDCILGKDYNDDSCAIDELREAARELGVEEY